MKKNLDLFNYGKMRMFDSRMLKRIFVRKREEVTGCSVKRSFTIHTLRSVLR
jgi:hypothetical protein